MDGRVMLSCVGSIKHAVIIVLILVIAPSALAAHQMISSPLIQGTVVSAQDASPVPGAVISALWLLKPNNEKTQNGATRPLLLEFVQVRSDRDGDFIILPWKNALPAGMHLVAHSEPLLRVYATGYRRSEISTSDTSSSTQTNTRLLLKVMDGQKIKLRPLAEQGSNTLVKVLLQSRAKELEIWRNDIDTVTDSPFWQGSVNKALTAQAELVRLIAKNCLLLGPDIRKQVCLTTNSKVANYLGTTTLDVAAKTTLQPSNGFLVAVPSEDPENPPRSRKRTIIHHHPPPQIMGGSAPTQ